MAEFKDTVGIEIMKKAQIFNAETDLTKNKTIEKLFNSNEIRNVEIKDSFIKLVFVKYFNDYEHIILWTLPQMVKFIDEQSKCGHISLQDGEALKTEFRKIFFLGSN